LINKFPDDVNVLEIIFDFEEVENKYINMIKRLYYKGFEEADLADLSDLYDTKINFENAVLNDNLNVSELKWAFHKILNWIG
jgi:hypothetical protein